MTVDSKDDHWTLKKKRKKKKKKKRVPPCPVRHRSSSAGEGGGGERDLGCSPVWAVGCLKAAVAKGHFDHQAANDRADNGRQRV